MTIFHGMDRATLGAAYNNTDAVKDSVRFLADWNARSDALARRSPQHLDLRHGERPRNRIDFFASRAKRAPPLVFIHGGYWQMRAKETFRSVAEGPLVHGISVALIGYTLAPRAPVASKRTSRSRCRVRAMSRRPVSTTCGARSHSGSRATCDAASSKLRSYSRTSALFLNTRLAK